MQRSYKQRLQFSKMCLPSRVRGATIQSLVTLIGNLLNLNFGLVLGITPGHTSLYQSAQTPLSAVINSNDTAWLTSYLFISAALGAATSELLIRKIGPKSVLLLCGLLQISSWFCIHFAYILLHIYFSRIFAGLAAGSTCVVLPIYIIEIAESQNKSASLILTTEFGVSLGILIGFFMGFYLKYTYVAIVGCMTSCCFSLCFPFVQESPYYFLRHDNEDKMEKSLRWFRGIRDIYDRNQPDFIREVTTIKKKIQDEQQIEEILMSYRYIYRILISSTLLAIGTQLNGGLIIMLFTNIFLSQTKDSVSEEYNYVILSCAQFMGTLFAYFFGTRLHRKMIIGGSSFLAILFLIFLILLRSTFLEIEVTYLPIVLLSLHSFFVKVGPSSMAFVIISEILPARLHNIVFAVVLSLTFLITFGLVKTFDILITLVGSSFFLWIFIGSCFIIVFVSLFLIPETRGHNAIQIQQLGYITSANVAKSTENVDGHITQI